MILSVMTLNVVKLARERSEISACSSRLRQLGAAFVEYKLEYKSFPVARPPLGFGDRHNWYDLWSHADPGGTVFSSMLIGGVMYGNRTDRPRVPRMMLEYTESLEVLHCSGQGASAWWPDVGPYWYNARSPFGSGGKTWRAMTELGKKGDVALAACQHPEQAQIGNSWRHGKKQPRAAKGENNHLMPGGAVRCFTNPKTWKAD